MVLTHLLTITPYWLLLQYSIITLPHQTIHLVLILPPAVIVCLLLYLHYDIDATLLYYSPCSLLNNSIAWRPIRCRHCVIPNYCYAAIRVTLPIRGCLFAMWSPVEHSSNDLMGGDECDWCILFFALFGLPRVFTLARSPHTMSGGDGNGERIINIMASLMAIWH